MCPWGTPISVHSIHENDIVKTGVYIIIFRQFIFIVAIRDTENLKLKIKSTNTSLEAKSYSELNEKQTEQT